MSMDFEPLAETLPLMNFEPASGLASRLAAMHGAGNAHEFCWDHFLDFKRIAAGNPAELAKFSVFSGAPFGRAAEVDSCASWAGFQHQW